MNTATQGRRVEHAVRHALEAHGWEVTRAAASRGFADLIAIRTGEVALVSVKRTTPPGPAERAALLRIADLIPTVSAPIVALGPASRLTWRLLTGPDARHYLPWSPE